MSKPRAYYNEIDLYAAQWLRNLIAAGEIPDGDVDTRSIEDVTPDDLRSYTQCHFFAGIGGWPRAFRLAGWPDDRPVWTGSCPCQPFSAAGKGKGFTDERHLWPAWHWLIDQCKPDALFGEQVASKDGLAWIDTVRADLEASGYAVGAVDLCAAGVGAPHIRQRQWIVAERLEHASGNAWLERRPEPGGRGIASGRSDGGVVYGQRTGLEGYGGHDCDGDEPGRQHAQQDGPVAETGGVGGVGDIISDGRGEVGIGHNSGNDRAQLDANGEDDRPGPTNGFWRDADWLFCRDGKWRPVEPGTFPLAHGVSARVGKLRAYGNAIVPQVAAEVVHSFMGVKS